MTNSEKLASRIVKLLEAEQQTDELATIFASIEKISHRLDKLERLLEESQASRNNSQPIQRPNHPSLDAFSIAEAVTNVMPTQAGKEKSCTFEPGGLPCDHCSMCNSRGY